MSHRVLVIDDSVLVRSDLHEVLAPAGFDVAHSESYRAAKKLLQRELFTLAVLDVTLADHGSLSLLEDLRAAAVTATLPVIVLSARTEIAERRRALEAGATDFIGKPFHGSYLVKRAKELAADPRVRMRASLSAPCRVLVVDDSSTYGLALAAELRRDGHDVVFAPSGHDAGDYLLAQRADCAVIDAFMPELDGLELCRLIRSDAMSSGMPVLLLTGSTLGAAPPSYPGTAPTTGAMPVTPRRQEVALKERVLSAGADDFMPKTSDLASIRVRLGELIQRAGADRTPQRRGSGVQRAPSVGAGADVAAPSSKPSFDRPLLLEKVIAASGLSKVIGRGSIEHALLRAGVEPLAISQESLARAMPEIEQTLSLFLPSIEVAARIKAIRAIARGESVA